MFKSKSIRVVQRSTSALLDTRERCEKKISLNKGEKNWKKKISLLRNYLRHVRDHQTSSVVSLRRRRRLEVVLSRRDDRRCTCRRPKHLIFRSSVLVTCNKREFMSKKGRKEKKKC